VGRGGEADHQHAKHLATVGIAPYLLVAGNICLYLCCCLAAQRMWLVAERIGEPFRTFGGRIMEWMYLHHYCSAKLQKTANMTKSSLNYLLLVKINTEKCCILNNLSYLCKINKKKKRNDIHRDSKQDIQSSHS
jgi:hypothetical protein